MEFENKMDRQFLNTKNGLQTDKKDKEEHGMGMGIMRDIVERNKGNFYCLAENGSFWYEFFFHEKKEVRLLYRHYIRCSEYNAFYKFMSDLYIRFYKASD